MSFSLNDQINQHCVNVHYNLEKILSLKKLSSINKHTPFIVLGKTYLTTEIALFENQRQPLMEHARYDSTAHVVTRIPSTHNSAITQVRAGSALDWKKNLSCIILHSYCFGWFNSVAIQIYFSLLLVQPIFICIAGPSSA